MKVIKKEQSRIIQNKACTIIEYDMHDKDINIAIVNLQGRYPRDGWAINTACKEMGFILSGSGQLITEHQSVHLSEGDVILIEIGEKYYWHGTMTIIVPATPAWYPEQHKIITQSIPNITQY